jgi:hypothetical protein
MLLFNSHSRLLAHGFVVALRAPSRTTQPAAALNVHTRLIKDRNGRLSRLLPKSRPVVTNR